MRQLKQQIKRTSLPSSVSKGNRTVKGRSMTAASRKKPPPKEPSPPPKQPQKKQQQQKSRTKPLAPLSLIVTISRRLLSQAKNRKRPRKETSESEEVCLPPSLPLSHSINPFSHSIQTGRWLLFLQFYATTKENQQKERHNGQEIIHNYGQLLFLSRRSGFTNSERDHRDVTCSEKIPCKKNLRSHQRRHF